MRGISNPHLQTILPRLFRRKPLLQPHWQRLALPDGDFIDLAWSEPPEQAQHKPRVVLFHGLEGSFYSPYAHGLLHAWKEAGWLGVVMHFRGCSGEPNKMNRIYHQAKPKMLASSSTGYGKLTVRRPLPRWVFHSAAICWLTI